MVKYYNTQQPIRPGNYPEPDRNKVLEVSNFDDRTYCKEAGRDCWGYIKYESPLAKEEAMVYNLVREQSLNSNQHYIAARGPAF